MAQILEFPMEPKVDKSKPFPLRLLATYRHVWSLSDYEKELLHHSFIRVTKFSTLRDRSSFSKRKFGVRCVEVDSVVYDIIYDSTFALRSTEMDILLSFRFHALSNLAICLVKSADKFSSEQLSRYVRL